MSPRLGSLTLAGAVLVGGGCGDPGTDLREVEQRVELLERGVEAAHRASWTRLWEPYAFGTSREGGALPGSLLAYHEVESLATWRGRVGGGELERRVDLLYRHCLRARVESDPEVAALTAAVVESRLGRVQRLEGIRVTDAVLAYMLRFDPRPQRRQEAWQLLYHGEAAAGARIAQLMARRNAIAREQGFADYYRLYLAQEDLDPALVERLLDELERRTREPARRAAERAASALGVTRLKPWDGEYALRGALGELEPLLTADHLHQRVAATCLDLGLGSALDGVQVAAPFAGSGARTYLAFPVDPPLDVRVIVTEGAGFYAYRGAFHETGHALYYRGATQARFVDRLPPNGTLSEAFAKLFERLPYQREWWQRYLGAPQPVVDLVQRYAAADELRRVRFFIANHRFERAAYADPEQDLDALYAALLGELTFEDWQGGGSSWTAIPHYATQPLANLEYLYARLIQAQVYRTLGARFAAVVGNPEVGPFLLEHLVWPGSTRRWTEIVREATGADLDVAPYLEDELCIAQE